MKILLMGFSKIKYMPYINFYLENIDRTAHEVHVLYWNRDLKEEDVTSLNGTKIHEFKSYQRDDVPQYMKIRNFIRYRRFLLQVIKKEKFDFVIILHSMPGILAYDVLKRKYVEKYIYDYRDITYEQNCLYKRIIHSLVANSCTTFISSEGFREILPREKSAKIYTTHNLLKESLLWTGITKKNNSLPIKICFWGLIREERLNRIIIEKVSQDIRFELHYYGREQKTAEKLKQYAKEINAKNIFFHGEYAPKDRHEFAKSTDIIHNLYESYNAMRAVTNKYYDGIIFEIPQLCMEHSAMAKYVECGDVGLAISPYDEAFTEKIYSYYTMLDKNIFCNHCKDEKDRILNEYKKAGNIIRKCIEMK